MYFFYYEGNAKLRSGMHYWEIRIDKIQASKESKSVLIGVSLNSQE